MVRMSDHHFHTLSRPTRGGGGGLPQKGKAGGFSGLNDKLDTDGQPYPTILYTSQGLLNKFGLDARAYTAIYKYANVEKANFSG